MQSYALLEGAMVLQGNSICQYFSMSMLSRRGHATGEAVSAVVHITDGLVAGGRASPHFLDASRVDHADDVVNGDGGLGHVCGHHDLAHSLPSPLKHSRLQPIPAHMLQITVSGIVPI